MSQYVARAVADAYEKNERANEFFLLARSALAGRGMHFEMLKFAETVNAPTRVKNIVQRAPFIFPALRKTVVDPMSIAVNADDLAPYQAIAAGFVSSLAPWSAFDAISNTPNAFRKFPSRTRAVLTTATATGTIVGESLPKPLTTIEVIGENLEPVKAIAFLITSDELATQVTPAGTELLRTELAQACGLTADFTFLTLMTESTGTQSAASSGMTPTAFLSDFEDALVSLQLDSTSKVFLAAPPNAVMKISVMNNNGVLCFPQMTINGGFIQGVQVIPSNALTDSMVMMDAHQIAIDAPAPIIEGANHATLELVDNPTVNPDQLVSLWQRNLRGLRVERWMAAKLLRSTGVATITGVNVSA
jgi:hypothetical protein